MEGMFAIQTGVFTVPI